MNNDELAAGIRKDLQEIEAAMGRVTRSLDMIGDSGAVVGEDLMHLQAYRQIIKGARHSVMGAHKGLEALSGQAQVNFGGK